MSGTTPGPTSGATGKTDFTGIVNALQMLAQAIGQNGKSLDAIKAALPGSLPAPSSGNALDMVRINSGGTAYEVRTPAQVASDIGVIPPPLPATVAPLVDGTAAVGTSLLYARQDHVHPAIPSWQVLASYTPSSVASQAIPLPSGFRRYRLTFQGVTVSTGSTALGLQVSINGGSSFITGATSYNYAFMYLASGTPSGAVGTNSYIYMTEGLSNSAGNAADGAMEIFPGSASQIFAVHGTFFGFVSVPNYSCAVMSGGIGAGATVNALSLGVFPSGTFSGTVILEGLP